MESSYVEFIERFTNDVRFIDTNLSFLISRRKTYKNGKEYELKILRIVVQTKAEGSSFLRTFSFRINHIIEENSAEVVTNLGYIKKEFSELDYKKISQFIYESVKDLKRKELSIREVL